MVPELDAPARSVHRALRCRCIAIPPDQPDNAYTRRAFRCPEDTNPDAPFCIDCEGRHTEYRPGTIITVWEGPE